VERILEWFKENQDYHALVGIISGASPHVNVSTAYFNLRKRYDYLLLDQPIGVIYGGVHAVRRNILNAVGGYDESFPEVEDAELAKRLTRAGYRIGLDHGLEVDHLHRMNLPKLLASDARRSGKHLRLLMQKRNGRSSSGGFRVASFRRGAILSVLTVPLTLISLVLGFMQPLFFWFTLAFGLATIGLNAGFLLHSARRRGFLTSLAFVPVIFLDMLAAGTGSFLGLIGLINCKVPLEERIVNVEPNEDIREEN
jgi:GT2 family glycosyltransferase